VISCVSQTPPQPPHGLITPQYKYIPRLSLAKSPHSISIPISPDYPQLNHPTASSPPPQYPHSIPGRATAPPTLEPRSRAVAPADSCRVGLESPHLFKKPETSEGSGMAPGWNIILIYIKAPTHHQAGRLPAAKSGQALILEKI
jgi:hypothetical protein